MIIARSPLRITLGGGGTDIPSYYEDRGGYLIAASIDKYVYVTVTRPFHQGIYLKYSELESVVSVNEIKHPIIREVFRILDLKTPQIELTSLADIPAGTGLGSSGSFTTALLKATYTHYKKVIHPKELAELACEIEINRLREPIGKQDQYIAAFGGITEFKFQKNGVVDAATLELSVETLHDLEDNLLLFYTGQSRKAGSILHDQVDRSKKGDKIMWANLDSIKELAIKTKELLCNGKTKEFGELMNEHWWKKKERSKSISNPHIDYAYERALNSGAVGGKLVGAGGGGFLMFYAIDTERLRSCMREVGLEEVRFRFDFEGTKILTV